MIGESGNDGAYLRAWFGPVACCLLGGTVVGAAPVLVFIEQTQFVGGFSNGGTNRRQTVPLYITVSLIYCPYAVYLW